MLYLEYKSASVTQQWIWIPCLIWFSSVFGMRVYAAALLLIPMPRVTSALLELIWLGMAVAQEVIGEVCHVYGVGFIIVFFSAFMLFGAGLVAFSFICRTVSFISNDLFAVHAFAGRVFFAHRFGLAYIAYRTLFTVHGPSRGLCPLAGLYNTISVPSLAQCKQWVFVN